MAAVTVTNIKVLNNPCPLNAPFLFEIHFEALQALKQDVEWRVVYVGSGGHHTASSRSTSLRRTDRKTNNNQADAAAASEDCMHADGEPQPAAAAASGSSAASNAKKKQQQSDRGADYLLDSVLLGPIERGALAFEFAVNAPDFTQMDPGSVEGMQAVLVCGLYKGKEFVRIGYYLNNAYSDCALRENPPETPIYEKLVRCVVDAPRVTRFQIDWDEEEEGEEEEGIISAEVQKKQKEEHLLNKKEQVPAAVAQTAADAGQQTPAEDATAAACAMEVDVN